MIDIETLLKDKARSLVELALEMGVETKEIINEIGSLLRQRRIVRGADNRYRLCRVMTVGELRLRTYQCGGTINMAKSLRVEVELIHDLLSKSNDMPVPHWLYQRF